MSAPTMVMAALNETTYQKPQKPTTAMAIPTGMPKRKDKQEDDNAENSHQSWTHAPSSFLGIIDFKKFVRKTSEKTAQPRATPYVKG